MIYGMGEQAIIDLGLYLKEGKDVRTIAGLCYISKEPCKRVFTNSFAQRVFRE